MGAALLSIKALRRSPRARVWVRAQRRSPRARVQRHSPRDIVGHAFTSNRAQLSPHAVAHPARSSKVALPVCFEARASPGGVACALESSGSPAASPERCSWRGRRPAVQPARGVRVSRRSCASSRERQCERSWDSREASARVMCGDGGSSAGSSPSCTMPSPPKPPRTKRPAEARGAR